MIPWTLIEKTQTPGNGKDLALYQRNKEFSIKVGTLELMNSRTHSSEDALGKLTCQRIAKKKQQSVLIGGLGMGFTLRVALNNLKAKAHVTVAELLPVVVKWNHDVLAQLTENPLADKRVTVYEGDVADKINTAKEIYTAILLDVDNGARGLTQKKNDRLYTPSGLKAAHTALQPKGILAIWSAGTDVAFTNRLKKAGFRVEEIPLHTHSGRKCGGQSVVWIDTKE